MANPQRPTPRTSGGNDSVNVWQLNCHHCRVTQLTLCKDLSGCGTPLVALLQEPYYVKGHIKSIPKNCTLYCSRDVRPRACVFASKYLNVWQLPNFCNRDVVAVAVAGRGQKICVYASVYMPGDTDRPPPDIIELLVDYCRAENLPLIIGADANSHHTGWGSSDTNVRGENLMDFIVTNDLQINNIGSSPTFRTNSRAEVLDITVSTAHLIGHVKGWKVMPNIYMSDHLCIRFSVSFETERLRPKRNAKNTDWDKFKLSFNDSQFSSSQELNSTVDIDNFVNSLTNCLHKSFNRSCPLSHVRRSHGVPWWTPELSKLRAEARRLQRLAAKGRASTDQAKAAIRTFKANVRKNKRTSWRTFCENMADLSPTARLVKTLKSSRTPQLGMLKRLDGSYTTSPDETLEVLLNTHFPDSTDSARTTATPPSYNVLSSGITDTVITPNKVAQALKSFKPLKSPGMDSVYPAMLQNMPNADTSLTKLYKACLRFGYTPVKWRVAKVIFIPKPGKPDYTNAKAFRPISLTSFMLKTLERLIYWYFQEFVLSERPFSTRQFAFRPGYSTETALHALVTRIERTFEDGEFALAIFLDIEGAFDNATTDAISFGMRHFNVPPLLSRFIKNLLGYRTAWAATNGCHRAKRIQKGCPQGGVLSPTLWNLVLDGLLQLFDRGPTYCQAYADDVILLQRGSDPDTVRSVMTLALRKVTDWGRLTHLTFNPLKTVAVMFTRRSSWSFTHPLTFQNVAVDPVDSTKYLGVVLDSRLTWQPHCIYASNRALAVLFATRRAFGTTWGLQPKTKLWIYNSMVLPIMLYGCAIWIGATKIPSSLKHLSKAQRVGLLGITSAFRGTPGSALEALLCIKPIEVALFLNAALTAHRLIRNKTWIGRPLDGYGPRKYPNHNRICHTLVKAISVMQMPSDSCTPCTANLTAVVVDIQDRGDFTLEPRQDGTIRCYTDGSKIDGATGCGVLIEFSDNTYKRFCVPLGQYATVFQAEVNALTVAAHALHDMTNCSVEFLSDSQAAIKALANPIKCCRSVLECNHALSALAVANAVKLRWIPGHSDYFGNEEADGLAKEAALSVVEGPEPFIGIPLAACRYESAEWADALAADIWTDCSGCRQSKIFLSSPSRSITRTLLSLPRSAIRNVLQILTGHGNLARYRCITKQRNSPLCPFCKEVEETPSHHVGSCPMFGEARYECFGERVFDFNYPVDSTVIRHLASFLSKTKRLDNFNV
jgi:ribonuclease HI